MDLSQYFVSLAALVPLVVLVTDIIIRLFGISSFTILKVINVRQLISWVVSFLATFVGVQFDFGIFAGIPTWHFVLYGAAVGLFSNGFKDIALVETVLNIVLKFLPKKQ